MCGEKEADTNTQKMFQSKVNKRWEWKKVKKIEPQSFSLGNWKEDVSWNNPGNSG